MMPALSKPTKAILIYSGGMDSYSLLRWMKAQDNIEIERAVSFHYGQRHDREIGCARAVCRHEKIPHQVIPLEPDIFNTGPSALTSGLPVPEGHYSEPTMSQTVVPGRNTVLLSAAMAIAEGLTMQYREPVSVYYGAHSGDHAIYPDCRPRYVTNMQTVFYTATEGRVWLEAPFLHLTKGELLRAAHRIGAAAADYAQTWSCYKGGAKPCGRCGACVERLEAFDFAKMTDPLEYEDREFYRKATETQPQSQS